MDTLIELYDERAIENVIGPEMFRPKRVVYISPQEIVEDRNRQAKLKEYFRSRGLYCELEFIACSMYKTDKIVKQLKSVVERYPKCVMDVTGGTDAALFAAGVFCQESGIPTFTYSRKKNSFYDISNAEFADDLPCTLQLEVEDFFRMAGGTMRKGRVDNSILANYMDKFDLFFTIFLRHRSVWADTISFMQRISQVPKGAYVPLECRGSYQQKGEHGSIANMSHTIMREFAQLGFIKDLEFDDEKQRVHFAFESMEVRNWLRDVGSVLELYIYKACQDTGIFHDVVSSAIVDWDGLQGHDSVSNEIDAVATRGVVPLFISCKTCEIKTEALNELAILKDRFGGKGAKAAIVTTDPCNAAARHRAAQLGIAVIDLEELESESVLHRLKVIMKVEEF